MRVKLSNRVRYTPFTVAGLSLHIIRASRPRLHQRSLSVYNIFEDVDPVVALDDDGYVNMDTGASQEGGDGDCITYILHWSGQRSGSECSRYAPMLQSRGL